MNLPAYRRALRRAYEQYREQMEKLALQLSEELEGIDAQFHDDQDEVRAAEVKHVH